MRSRILPPLLWTLLTGLSLILPGRLTAQTFTTLYSFTASSTNFSDANTNSDGTHPKHELTLSGNTLYGVGWAGGSSGNGTVFKVNTDGKDFAVLYHFTATSNGTNSDGKNPTGGLILSGDTLYGTTEKGGSSGYGTIFAVNTEGTGFTNLHSFTDNVYQVSGLILSSNTLYGTTDLGGTSGNGSIFSLNTDGTAFTTLYSFTARSGYANTDGANPLAALILSGNILYGTTAGGGSNRGGTVFRLNTDGTDFTNLYTFSSDGYDPNAGLTLSGNTLFGATATGLGYGDGTVFKLKTDGTDFTNLYHFSVGAYPFATLLLLGTSLYGSTSGGGSFNDGTVFKVNTDGTGFTNLYSFTPLSAPYTGTNSDGTDPSGTLVSSGNMLYGTAYRGGSSGNGTVFSLSLPVPPQLTIIPVGEGMILTWPANYSDFVLQCTTNLVSPVVWTTNSVSPVVVNGQNTVTNSITGTQQFYRLSQ